MAVSISARNAPKVFRKTLTFAAGAGTGNIGTVAVATMTGSIFIQEIGAICTTSLTADGAATIEMGVANDTACLLAQATATTLDAGMAWAATPDEGIPTAVNLTVTGNIIITVATANLTAGVITVVCYYKPMTYDGFIV
jgi:hypothetical protein